MGHLFSFFIDDPRLVLLTKEVTEEADLLERPQSGKRGTHEEDLPFQTGSIGF